MDQKKKWQVPVLVLGVLLLAVFGFNAARTMSGQPRVAVKAKNPEHVKKKPPKGPEKSTDTEPATPAPRPSPRRARLTEALASIQLPDLDPFETLPALRVAEKPSPSRPKVERGAAQVSVPFEIPAPAVGAPNPFGGLLTMMMGGSEKPGPTLRPSTDSARESGTNRVQVQVRGTVTGGGRHIAVVRAEDSEQPSFLSEGDPIAGGAASVERIRDGGITISGPFGTTTVKPKQGGTTPPTPVAEGGGAS